MKKIFDAIIEFVTSSLNSLLVSIIRTNRVTVMYVQIGTGLCEVDSVGMSGIYCLFMYRSRRVKRMLSDSGGRGRGGGGCVCMASVAS